MLDELKRDVCDANLRLVEDGLVVLTWGNVSGFDRGRGLMAIKPSGVPYGELRPEHIVLVDLDGKVAEGRLRPSVDTPTHLALYRAFPAVAGVTHSHSAYATVFAQACREVPCLGTTHADHFNGAVPVTRPLTPGEIAADYEGGTGTTIVECLAGRNPMEMPAVLVAHHGPFTWGASAAESVRNAVALEHICRMALATLQLTESIILPKHYLAKHYGRKHGPGAQYGQSRV